MCIRDSGNVIQNVVSESDDIEIVSESERVMGCKGVETNVRVSEFMIQ